VTFDKAPGGKIGPYRLDANDSAAMTLRLANGALGVCHASRFATGHLNDLRARIYGERGGIEVAWEGNISRIRISEGPDLADGIWRELAAPPVPTTYERFIAAIRGEAPMDPDFHRGAALQAVLDRAEESDAQGGRTLAV
jgi:predicted dehydrogenase